MTTGAGSAKTDPSYPGGELPLFAHAVRWKRYWSGVIRPHLHGDVLDVGAGLGETTALFRLAMAPAGPISSWHCLEPDREMADGLRRRFRDEIAAGTCAVVSGTTGDLDAARRFDAVLYVDVLEHVADDAGELARAGELLRPGGRLIVLAPAHQLLYSEFDRAIGHHRRYDRRSLAAAAPAGLRPVLLRYLDAGGLALSLANRLLLRQSMPTLRQIQVWDRLVVPVSRVIDPLLLYRAGKSVLGIWVRDA